MTTAFPPNKPAINPTSHADLDIVTLLISKNQPLYGAITARSYHPGGVNALFADGSVRFVKSTIDGAHVEGARHGRRGRSHQQRFVLMGDRATRAARAVRRTFGRRSPRPEDVMDVAGMPAATPLAKAARGR